MRLWVVLKDGTTYKTALTDTFRFVDDFPTLKAKIYGGGVLSKFLNMSKNFIAFSCCSKFYSANRPGVSGEGFRGAKLPF